MKIANTARRLIGPVLGELAWLIGLPPGSRRSPLLIPLCLCHYKRQLRAYGVGYMFAKNWEWKLQRRLPCIRFSPISNVSVELFFLSVL